jgi:hypothetical protein
MSQEVDVTLTPREAQKIDVYSVEGDDLASIGKSLRDAIQGAQQSIKNTYGKGIRTLNTDEISVQMAFSITWGSKLGGSKIPIVNLSISPSVEKSVKTTNTITVTFSRPPPKK